MKKLLHLQLIVMSFAFLLPNLCAMEKSMSSSCSKENFAAFTNALAADDVESMKELILLDASLLAANNREKKTALHRASAVGASTCLLYLLSLETKLEATDIHGGTALHLAALNGHASCVELLAANSAKLEPLDSNKCAPLHLAAINGHTDCLRLLISKGARVQLKADYDDSPLHLAIIQDKADCVRILLDAAADRSAVNKRGQTALQDAMDRGSFECVKVLLATPQEKMDPLAGTLAGGEPITISPRLEAMTIFKKMRKDIQQGEAFPLSDITKETWDHITEHTDDLFVLTEIKNGAVKTELRVVVNPSADRFSGVFMGATTIVAQKTELLAGPALEKFNALVAAFATSCSRVELNNILNAANYLEHKILIELAQKAYAASLGNELNSIHKDLVAPTKAALLAWLQKDNRG